MTPANNPAATARASARVVLLAGADDYPGWRDAARRLAASGVPADDVAWQTGGEPTDLLADPGLALPPEPGRALRVSRQFPELAETAILHRDPERFTLLYRLLLALQTQTRLLDDPADPLVRRVQLLAKAVRRDMHKMRAFLRFRQIDDQQGERYVAWFEPDHHVLRANAGFFVRRFGAMRWSILTPELSIHWDGEALREGPGADRAQAPGEDALEEMWHAYYAATFNPSRLNVAAMVKEMPRRYWKNLPETRLIAPLVAGAQAREVTMTAQVVAPEDRPTTLAALAQEAQSCRRCPLWQGTNGCVFGEGPGDARLMVVGEQPGDGEDKAQHPFVGPAGKLLDRALDEAGIDRATIYVTNAVKHFKYVQRGKRRLHQKPNSGEIDACRWWLGQEIGLIRPRSIVMLGATAIRGVTSRAGAVTALRGKPVDLTRDGFAGSSGVATFHPAYVLRLPEREAADEAFRHIVEDLRLAAQTDRRT
ncbi:MAG: UdgX family uracil-DNA binding protein [Novosphingobium sp.]